MVVGVAEAVLAAGPAEQLERAVGDHLVRVHVGRGAGAALDHVDDEVSVPVAVDDLLARPVDRGRRLGREEPELAVGARRGLLHHCQVADEGGVVRELNAGDREVLDAAQRLDAVERIRRHVALAEEVVLAPSGAGGVRLLHPDLAGAGVEQAPVHRHRHPAQHLDRRGAVGGEPRQHLLAVELEERQAGAGARRSGMRGGVQECALAEHFAGAEDGEELALAVVVAYHLDGAGGDQVDRPARLPLPEEDLAATQLAAPRQPGEQLGGRVRDPRQRQRALQQRAKLRHRLLQSHSGAPRHQSATTLDSTAVRRGPGGEARRRSEADGEAGRGAILVGRVLVEALEGEEEREPPAEVHLRREPVAVRLRPGLDHRPASGGDPQHRE